MKKKKIVLWTITIVLMIGAAGGVVGYIMRMSADRRDAVVKAISDFARGSGAEAVTTALTYTSAVLGILWPVIVKVRKSSTDFSRATASMQGTEEATREIMAALAQWKTEMESMYRRSLSVIEETHAAELETLRRENAARIAELQAQVCACTDRMDADHKTVTDTFDRAERIQAMLLLGLCNQPAIVGSGQSHKIAALSAGTLTPAAVMKKGGAAIETPKPSDPPAHSATNPR